MKRQTAGKPIVDYLFPAIFSAVLIGGPSNAVAQQALPWYEPFAYAPGNLVGQGGWTQTGSATGSPIQVAAGSLSYAGLPSASGGKLVLANGTNYQDAGRDVMNQASGTVYASFVLNVNNPGNTTGDYIFHFSSAGTGALDFRSRVLVRQASAPTKFQLGLSNLSTDTPSWTSAEYDVGVPLLVVVAYAFAPNVNDDTALLWVNPALGQSLAPAPTLTQPVLTDLTSLGRVGWRQGQGDSLLSVEVDELRLGLTWTDVTPQGSSHVLDWELY